MQCPGIAIISFGTAVRAMNDAFTAGIKAMADNEQGQSMFS